jgi:hypothetical protein
VLISTIDKANRVWARYRTYSFHGEDKLMTLHVPSLAKKLQCLYQRHQTVNTHELLAGHLGIAPNNISTWINGNEVRGRELVPNRHIKRITDLFEIPVQWLEIDSLEEFKVLLRSSPLRDGPWPQLLARAASSDAIHLVRQQHRLEQETQSRGLIADDDEPLEQFQLGERLYISVALNDEWSEQAQHGEVYAVLLSVDRAKTTCLCPSLLAPNPQLSSSTFLVPQKAPENSLKVAGPVGLQSVLALVTRSPLTTDLYSGLMQGCGAEVLDRLATYLTQTPAAYWRLFRKDYEVL